VENSEKGLQVQFLCSGITRLRHVGFDDPARATRTKEMILTAFRKVRDEITRYLKGLPESRKEVGEGS
jgi:hypothetical protein